MEKEFLDYLEGTFKGELTLADKDCFRRRTVLIDLLEKIKKEKEMVGLI